MFCHGTRWGDRIAAVVGAVLLLGCAAAETDTPTTPSNIVTVTTNDFEDGTAQGWMFLGTGWRLVSDDGNQMLEGRGSSSGLLILPFRNPTFECSLSLVSGSTTIGYRANLGFLSEDIAGGHSHGDSGHKHGLQDHPQLPIGQLNEELEGYAVDVSTNKLVLRTTPEWMENAVTLAEKDYAFGLKTPRTIRITSLEQAIDESTAGRTIAVYVDGEKILEATHGIPPCQLDDSCTNEDENPNCFPNDQRCAGEQLQLCGDDGTWALPENCPQGQYCMIMPDGFQHCMTMDGPMGEPIEEVRLGMYLEPHDTSIIRIDDVRLQVPGAPEESLVQTGIMHGGGATAMQFSPSEPDTVYLITGYNALGAWRSKDGGETWTRFYQGLHLLSIGMDPVFADHLLIGDNIGQIMRSTNSGLSWDIVASAPQDVGEFEEGYAANIWGFVFDPADPTQVYAASSDKRFLVSSDRGSTWDSVDAAYPDATSLAIDQGGAGTLYVGTTSGVWRSDNEGMLWSPTADLPGITMSVVTHPTDSGILIAGTTLGLFRSENFGDSWTEQTDGLSYNDITIVEWSRADPNTILAGTYEGVFVSRDGGSSWGLKNQGLTNVDTGALAASPADPDHFVSATADWWFNRKPGEHSHPQGPIHATPGTFLSRNGGDDWSSLGDTYQDLDAYALAATPTKPGTVYVGTMCSRGLYSTADYGKTFTHLPAQASHYTMRVEISPWDDNTVLMTSATGVHRSDDGGANWDDLLLGGHFHGLGVSPDKTLYAGTASMEGGAAGHGSSSNNDPPPDGLDMSGGHVFRSDDNGQTWQDASAGLDTVLAAMSAVNTIVVAPSEPDVVYAAADAAHGGGGTLTEPFGLYRSANRGDAWEARNQGLPSLAISDLAIDANDSAHLYAATRSGVARTNDGGASWTRVLSHRANAVSLASSGLVVVGAQGAIHLSSDNGATWHTIVSGIDGKNVWDFVIAEETNTIFAGVDDRGLRQFSVDPLGLSLQP